MIQLSSPLIVGAAFAGAGIYALGRGFRDLARAIDSEDWPAVDGEILDAGVDTDFASRGRMYSAAVRYRYSAGGVAHEGDRIAFGGPIETSWRGPAEKTAARYRKGASGEGSGFPNRSFPKRPGARRQVVHLRRDHRGRHLSRRRHSNDHQCRRLDHALAGCCLTSA